jgi:hypothetical protein
METDVEDDADTVADTKDAREASSPDGASAASVHAAPCAMCSVVVMPFGPWLHAASQATFDVTDHVRHQSDNCLFC